MLRVKRLTEVILRGRRALPATWALLGLLAVPAGAQTAERPRIGLALAGGGAKGIAHVGVLEMLEEWNVPVDYVAGTSMGAIVGGLWASGFTPAELASTIESVDWPELMSDDPPRRDLSFRRKQDSGRYLLDLELGIGRDGLAAPSGLQTGQKLTLLLQWLTRHVADVRDFDELPTPFRCVAADINSGETVVLDGGDLARAIRASMAIPGVFTPVELDGRTLVDGGITNNLPIDVVRSMGADIVIAVDLAKPDTDRQVEGWFGIFGRMTQMLTRQNVELRLPDADILLVPPWDRRIGTLEFSGLGEIRAFGRAAAVEKEAELRALAVDPETYERFAARRDKPPAPKIVVGDIRLQGNERVDPRVIRSVLTVERGAELDPAVLEEDLGTIYGLGDFERVGFRLEPRANDTTDLVIDMDEKPWGPNYLHFGLFFDSDLDSEFNASMLVNLTMTRLNARGAEWRNDLRIGRRHGLFSELYQPLGFRGGWFAAPTLSFERRRPDLFIDGERVAELRETRWAVGAGLGYQFSKYAEVRAVAEYGNRRLAQETGSLEIASVDSRVAGLRLIAEADRLDDVVFPTIGTRTTFNLFSSRDELGSEVNYNTGELRYSQFHPRGRTRLLWGLEAASRIGAREIPIWDLFTLGGFGSLSGFADDELRGQYKGVLRAGLYRELGESLRIGGFLEAGNVWQDTDDIGTDTLIYTATAFVGLDSLLGPIILAWGVSDASSSQVYLTIGRTF